MNVSVELEDRLRKLDQVIDPAHAEASGKLQLAALAYEEVERLPMMVYWPAPDWPIYPYHEEFHDREKMLSNQLSGVWAGALVKDDRSYTIRANYGVGIVASIFGCGTRLLENQMPWVEPLDQDGLERALSNGVPDLSNGLGGLAMETERYYLDVLSRFDNISQAVHIYACDVQGPFDLAHLVMGHRIYTDVIDSPDLVHRMLDLVTDTFIAFVRLQEEIIGGGNGTSYHSHHCIKGAIRVCEDSPTNLSAEMYREFCRPYNERVLKELGGGWIHYCGKGYQMFPEVCSTPGVYGLNFGNPEKQDPNIIFPAVAEAGIGIVSWPREVPEGTRTGLTRSTAAETLEEARRMIADR